MRKLAALLFELLKTMKPVAYLLTRPVVLAVQRRLLGELRHGTHCVDCCEVFAPHLSIHNHPIFLSLNDPPIKLPGLFAKTPNVPKMHIKYGGALNLLLTCNPS